MKRKHVLLTMGMLLITMSLAGCGNSDATVKTEEVPTEVPTESTAESNEATAEATSEASSEAAAEGTESEYYLNEQGYLVDKVEEFQTETFGDYTLMYPILNEGVDEVVVYEFDTADNVHVIIDATNTHQQTNLDEIGDYGDVQLETVATGDGVVYMYDGERYYIEDSARNILTISNPITAN